MIDRYNLIRILVPGMFTAIIATSSYAVIDAGISATDNVMTPMAMLTHSLELPAIESNKPTIISKPDAIALQKIKSVPIPPLQQTIPQKAQPDTAIHAHSKPTTIAKVVSSPAPTEPEPPQLETTQPVHAPQWLSRTIEPGESLSAILGQMGVGYRTLQDIVTANEMAKELTLLQAGKTLDYRMAENGDLDKLIYHKSNLETITVSNTEHGFQVVKEMKDLQRVLTFTEGTIHSSLFWDAKRAGLSDRLTMQLANIYAWDIDFALDLRVGDKFSVLHETFIDNDKIVKTGHILAANFINKGKEHIAVRYAKQDSKFKYYSPDGKPLHTRFLRTPVEFARISSRYNLRRKHPVLNRIRAHKGVDYAAAKGTPVHSTASGKIIFRGRKGGYGNVVIVKHDRRYETLYAHLSRFSKKYKKGSRVEQGDVVGYIGSTGLATGPHLHYEFHVNGKHKNPLTVSLAQASPIRRELLADFKAETQPLLSRLEQNSSISVAQAN